MMTEPTKFPVSMIEAGNLAQGAEVVSVGKSEAEKAADYKKRALEMLEPFLRLRDEAMRDGLTINFSVGLDNYGRNQALDLHVAKRF
jgi:hypothetical protein